MKFNKKWYGCMVLWVVFFAVAVLTQDAVAGRRPGFADDRGGLFPFSAFLRGLDLSDGQKEQVKEVVSRFQPEFQTAAKELASARQALQETIRLHPNDQETWRQAFKTVTDGEWNMLLLREKVRVEIFKILTPEQIAKLEARRVQRQQRQNRLPVS